MKAKTYYEKKPTKTKVVSAPDGAIAYFRENIEKCDAPGDEGGTCYRCDEYFVYIQCTQAVAQQRVAANTAAWLAKAKADEDRREADEAAASEDSVETTLMELAADHEERICVMELLYEEE